MAAGNGRRRRRPEAEDNGTATAIYGLPARFLRLGGRGGRGGGFGRPRSARGGPRRRRRAVAAAARWSLGRERKGHGEGAGERESGERGPARVVSGSSLTTREKQGGTAPARVQWRRRRPVDHASVATGRRRPICGEPLGNISKIAARSSSNLSELNRALGHFHKFQENSYKLDLPFRTSTKIDEAK